MVKWQGWVAAFGGLISILGAFIVGITWFTWVGGIIALVFGIWAAI